MEIKRGYQQTEAGVIPEDWSVYSLGSLAEIAAGGTPSRRIPEYWNGDIPWVTTTEINFNTILATSERLTTLGVKNSAAKLLFPGTLLLALYGQGKTRGKVAVLGIRATTNQACASIILSPTVSRSFVFHFLASRYRAIRNLSNSGSQENLSGKIVRSIAIPLPPTKAEQEAIAEALSDADALVESLEQLLAKKRRIKQSAMQELLTGKKRLPGFCGKWEVRPLGAEITALDAGVSVNSTDNAADSDPGAPSILKTSCVDRGVFTPTECKRIAPKDVCRAKLNPRSDSILVSRMNTIDLVGECGYVDANYPDLFVPDRLWLTRFRRGSDISAKWLTYILSSEHYRALLKAAATGTSGSMKNIAKGALLSLEVIFPQGPEQTAIATILSDMDAEIAALEAKLTKALQIKQGMMQELLTGRIRLV
jgi:type I restriction enzyme S subunit